MERNVGPERTSRHNISARTLGTRCSVLIPLSPLSLAVVCIVGFSTGRRFRYACRCSCLCLQGLSSLQEFRRQDTCLVHDRLHHRLLIADVRLPPTFLILNLHSYLISELLTHYSRIDCILSFRSSLSRLYACILTLITHASIL